MVLEIFSPTLWIVFSLSQQCPLMHKSFSIKSNLSIFLWLLVCFISYLNDTNFDKYSHFFFLFSWGRQHLRWLQIPTPEIHALVESPTPDWVRPHNKSDGVSLPRLGDRETAACSLLLIRTHSEWSCCLVERPTCQELREVSSKQPAWSYSTHLSCTQIPDPQKLR